MFAVIYFFLMFVLGFVYSLTVIYRSFEFISTGIDLIRFMF